MAERYVRPPLVAAEPGARRWPVWRFRLVLLVLLAALVVGIVFLARALVTPTGEGSPSVGGLRAPAAPVAAAR